MVFAFSSVRVSIIYIHSLQCTSLSSSSSSNPTALSRSVLFAKDAVHTYLKTCQCLDALPGNPCATVDPALADSTVLASSFWMLDLLAEIWSSLPVLSSIPRDYPPSSLFTVSSWNRCTVQIVSCIAELLPMLGLVLLELCLQLSTLLILSTFQPAPGFYEGRIPVPGYLFLLDSCAWASLLLPLNFRPHIGDPSLCDTFHR